MLLYADDTVVFATSEETLIQSLNLLSGIEKVHNFFFFKRILKVKQSTPSVMLYGD